MDLDSILNIISQKDVDKIQVGGFDLDGVLRAKYVSREKFLSAATDGFGFCDVIFGWDSSDSLYDRGRFTGWHSGFPDLIARLDLDTFRLIPWEPRTALCLADFYTRSGEPLPFCPRQTLKRAVSRAEDAGFTPRMAVEYEFYVFEEDAASLHEKDFRSLKPESPGLFCYSPLRASARQSFIHANLDGLPEFGIDIEGLHTESGPGMFEACIKYGDAVPSADNAGLFKLAVKQIAQQHGLTATFMAKVSTISQGCGGHVHQSFISKVGENLFAGSGERGSDLAHQYIAGQQKCMPEWMALLCPTVNSYKRLVPDLFAPTTATWGIENRTSAIRFIPGTSAKATRVETRIIGADANPHLALAACLAAGLYGIEHVLQPSEPTVGNAYADVAAVQLPRTLAEATARLKQSETARVCFGGEFVDHFCMTREWECREFDKAVTDWELRRYLEII